MKDARRLVFISLLVVFVLAGSATASSQETPPGDIPITGHGWGHGRGMGQFGALGYATDFGWSSDQILNHFYSGTTKSTVPNSNITVRLEAVKGVPTVAAVGDGAVVLLDSNDNITHVSQGNAIRLTATSGGFSLADAPSCAGPFVERGLVIPGETVRISSASISPSGGSGNLGASRVIVGDWDGDGDDDLGVAGSGGRWRFWNDFRQGTPADRSMQWNPGEAVAVGDWDGDGIDTPARFIGGTWTMLNGFDPDGPRTQINFGQTGDVLVPGDWDGDGDDDPGIKRDRNWSLSTDAGTINFSMGGAQGQPIVGDWDGNGRDEPGFVAGDRWFYSNDFTNASFQPAFKFVDASKRLVGDWNGDGVDTPASNDGGFVDLTGPLDGVTPRLNPNLPLAQTIQHCAAAGVQTFYRGELRAVHNGGNQRTVNAVPIESYLRSVVPREMPASWALINNGAGAAALQSQAVAARSYASAERRASYAQTCDTISCQVYSGRATRRSGTITSNENSLSDAAIQATSGVVRAFGSQPARTEFSSSTGGWTAGGVFSAVEDRGDAVSRNPRHDWSDTVTVAEVEGRFNGRTLSSIQVIERNGLGEDGGRVEKVELRFGDETFTMTGNQFRIAFGLLSDWFSVNYSSSGAQLDGCICPERLAPS